MLKAAPIARLGYRQYSYINNVFDMTIPSMPDEPKEVAAVLAGALPYGNPEDEEEEQKDL